MEGQVPDQHCQIIRKQGDEGMDSQRRPDRQENGRNDGKRGKSGTLQVPQQVCSHAQEDDEHIYIGHEPDDDRGSHTCQPVIGGNQGNQSAPWHQVLKILHGKDTFEEHGAEGKGCHCIWFQTGIGAGNPEQYGQDKDNGRGLLIAAHGL